MPAPILVPLPSQGTVAGRPRKESLIDTEVFPGGTVPARQTSTFSSLGAFLVAPATSGLTKSFGRDTNLKGTSSGGLPAAAHFFWYAWRAKFRALGANLNTDANTVLSEQINRLWTLLFVQFNFQTSNLMTQQCDELPSGVGPQFIATTRAGATMLSLPNGVPERKNSKDMLIMGRPVELGQNEQFTVDYFMAQAPTVAATPLVDIFVSSILDGILLRGTSS